MSALRSIGDSVDHAKIFVSSREDSLIQEYFKQFQNLKIRPNNVSADIESYVDATLRARIASKALKVRDEKLQREILETLVLKAEGM